MTVAHNVRVEGFTLADLGGVQRVEEAAFVSRLFPASFFSQIAAVAPETFLVAHHGDEVVGYVVALRDQGSPVVAWVLSIGVEPTSQDRGIGTQLLQEIRSRFEERGVSLLRLFVSPQNVSARRLYQRLGFVELGLRADIYGPGEHRVLLEQALRPVSERSSKGPRLSE